MEVVEIQFHVFFTLAEGGNSVFNFTLASERTSLFKKKKSIVRKQYQNGAVEKKFSGLTGIQTPFCSTQSDITTVVSRPKQKKKTFDVRSFFVDS